MGYTHSFTYQPASPQYATAWPAILADSRRILREIRRRGIVLRGPDGTGQPTLGPARIGFNGDATSGLAREGFVLPAPHRVTDNAPADCRVWRFIKTQGRPYDLAVTAVLLHCHLLAPDTFVIGSDGAWDDDWTQPPEDNPRDLIRTLFGTHVDHDPLTDPSEGMAIGPSGWIDPRLVDNPMIP